MASTYQDRENILRELRAVDASTPSSAFDSGKYPQEVITDMFKFKLIDMDFSFPPKIWLTWKAIHYLSELEFRSGQSDYPV